MHPVLLENGGCGNIMPSNLDYVIPQLHSNALKSDLKGKICHVYPDDVIIFSEILEEHHLLTAFQKLNKADLIFSLTKCSLFM